MTNEGTSMYRLLAASLLFAALTTAPSHAGEGLGCTNGDQGVVLHLPLAASPGFELLEGVEIKVGGAMWSTSRDAARTGGTPIMAGQSFGDDENLRADFYDENAERVVAKLRLVVGAWGDEPVIAGIVWLEEAGAFAVTCY
jgi:hypothetical protein